MHLTTFTDYSLRVLMYLSLHPDKLCTAGEISDYFNVSQNHVVKVINNLGKLGVVHTQRGKGGGIRLEEKALEQNVGALVRLLEPEKELVQCVNKQGEACSITHACKLTPILDQALDQFYRHLDQYTLKDIIDLDSAEPPAPISISFG